MELLTKLLLSSSVGVVMDLDSICLFVRVPLGDCESNADTDVRGANFPVIKAGSCPQARTEPLPSMRSCCNASRAAVVVLRFHAVLWGEERNSIAQRKVLHHELPVLLNIY